MYFDKCFSKTKMSPQRDLVATNGGDSIVLTGFNSTTMFNGLMYVHRKKKEFLALHEGSALK